MDIDMENTSNEKGGTERYRKEKSTATGPGLRDQEVMFSEMARMREEMDILKRDLQKTKREVEEWTGLMELVERETDVITSDWTRERKEWRRKPGRSGKGKRTRETKRGHGRRGEKEVMERMREEIQREREMMRAAKEDMAKEFLDFSCKFITYIHDEMERLRELETSRDETDEWLSMMEMLNMEIDRVKRVWKKEREGIREERGEMERTQERVEEKAAMQSEGTVGEEKAGIGEETEEKVSELKSTETEEKVSELKSTETEEKVSELKSTETEETHESEDHRRNFRKIEEETQNEEWRREETEVKNKEVQSESESEKEERIGEKGEQMEEEEEGALREDEEALKTDTEGCL
ncbi:hypothetical protein AAFF_G00172960 [Aldrovandia affinis]|uniref:Uncharacterized protein n=1 Tax=Aldrovandia affinis TaxID=143900 RepID=A0AAD7SYV3_9TELE|nr:hypothetical protein AAFF_G00172960 [Aldrovandia affinis]